SHSARALIMMAPKRLSCSSVPGRACLQRGNPRPGYRALLVVVVLVAAGCGKEVLEPGEDSQLEGRWRYEATRQAPFAAMIVGEMEVTGRAGQRFGGRIEMWEDTPQGTAVGRGG